MQQASALYRLLGDEARLRLLRLLARERFNVSELTGILGLAQSGVSRHLGLLKDAGLVVEERDAGFTYYRVAPRLWPAPDRKRLRPSEGRTPRAGASERGWGPASSDSGGVPAAIGKRVAKTNKDGGSPALWAMLEAEFKRAGGDAIVRADDARLQEVLRVRKENFETYGGPDARDARQLVPGRSWAAWSRALGLLLPPLKVADLGCGEGYLTVEASRWASRVIAVDRSVAVLTRARGLARRRHVTNVIWKHGELEKLPISDETVDVALLSQALHHAHHPARAIAEAVRITVPGGRVLVLDLRAHHEEWVRAKLGDRRLGFDDEELKRMLGAAGLRDVRVGVGARRTGDPFTVLIAAGRRIDS